MKRIAALVFSITLVLFAAGCSKSNGNQSAAATHKGTMDFSQAASSDTTVVYGRVDSIVGNEVTLALGKPQQQSEETASSSSVTDGDSAKTQTAGEQEPKTEGQSSEKRGSGGSGTRQWSNSTSGSANTGEMPSGAAQSGEMPSGEMPSQEGNTQQSGTQRARSVTLDYTGETATYLLPVGMTIGTGDFSDVTEGMVLSLTLSADSTITAVTILSR